MDKFFENFLADFEFTVNPPATEKQIADLEAAFDIKLPASIRKLYKVCNGGRAKYDRCDLQLYSLDEAVEHGYASFVRSNWGYFPFAENNDSNPMCVCCKSPLAGYVVQVMHDDAPRLKYRGPEGFFNAALKHGKKTEFIDTYDFPSDFDGPKRLSKDLTIARKLIGAADMFKDPDRTHALEFACDLLADDCVDEIGAMLKDQDEYVREHASARLARASGTKAKKILASFEGDREEFVEHCAGILKKAKVTASVVLSYGKKTIRIDPGPIWLNMDVFFSARKRANFEEFLLERVRYFMSQSK